jgi:hypothetical protein
VSPGTMLIRGLVATNLAQMVVLGQKQKIVSTGSMTATLPKQTAISTPILDKDNVGRAIPSQGISAQRIGILQ